MLRQVQSYIKQNALLQPGDRVLVALSGGADSVALLDLLLGAGYQCIAAHCNFHLRGEESMRDEQFVRNLTEQLGVELAVQNFDTTAYARANKLSIEMAARELRYAWFEQMRQHFSCNAIAVAHHKNDQAETLLLNLTRGTGIRGLAGMRPENNHIIRPLLCTTHADILRYLKIRKLEHVEDSTNTDTDIKRNHIRQLMGEFPESAVEHIAETAGMMQGYNSIIDDYIKLVRPQIVKTEGKDTHIDIAKLLETPAPQTVLYELLREFGFPQTDEIFSSLKSTSGKYFYSSTHQALKDRKYLIVSLRNTCESGILQYNTAIRSKNTPESYPDAMEMKIVVDSKIMDKPISFRHPEPGDRFTPIGMKKSKKLQDFFTDLHLSRKQKQEVWLMLSGDEIAWVAGYRISDKFKVTEKTKQVAEITVTLTKN